MPGADQAPRKKSVCRPSPEHLPGDEKVYAPTAFTFPACGGGLRPYTEGDVIIGEPLHSGKMVS